MKNLSRLGHILVSTVVVSGMSALPVMAGAQGLSAPRCPAGAVVGGVPNAAQITQDGCQKAIDLFQYLAPQLALSLTGGNATAQNGGTIGRPGHFAIGARVTIVQGSLPQTSDVEIQTSGAQQSTFDVKRQILGIPTADLAVGLFNGFSVGALRMGAADALVSATYIPEFNSEDFSLQTPSGSLKLGFGVRIGLIQEKGAIPGLSATVISRSLPKLTVSTISEGDTLGLRDLAVNTTAWRLVLTKDLRFIKLMTGAGMDHYTTSVTIAGAMAERDDTPAATIAPTLTKQVQTRSNMFFDITLFKIFNVSVGRASGGKIDTYNQFDGVRADAPRVYSTAAFAFGW